MVATDEFKKVKNARSLACCTGVAPFGHKSGTSVRAKRRVSHFSNKKLKAILHMGALSAVQNSEQVCTYYERKVKAGKPKLWVIHAVKSKLIARMYACVRDNRI